MNRVEHLFFPTGHEAINHRLVTTRVMVETILIFAALGALALNLGPRAGELWTMTMLYGVVWLAQGLMLQRIYIIAHEAAHKKLAPNHARANDVLGQAVLLPMLVPLQIYRAIHNFHHGFNRRNVHTSALDVFVSPWRVTPLIRAVCYVLWFLGVFAGGLFLHSLVSLVLFLCLPTQVARKVSPAFKNWDARGRAIAWAQFLVAVAFHAFVAFAFGNETWIWTLGLPLVTFAWIWSLMVYVFHYRTTMGVPTRFNVRAIRANGLLRYWLMNFNEHATHHLFPNLPWYELPRQLQELPAEYAERNRIAPSLARAILNQLAGPTVVYARDKNPVPHLLMHWEE